MTSPVVVQKAFTVILKPLPLLSLYTSLILHYLQQYSNSYYNYAKMYTPVSPHLPLNLTVCYHPCHCNVITSTVTQLTVQVPQWVRLRVMFFSNFAFMFALI